MRNQRGITLIALVITIIVLLILAGVSIAMLTGENGILTRSRQAADETAIAGAKEAVSNAINEAITGYYANVYVEDGSSTVTSAVNKALTSLQTNYDGDAKIRYETGTVTITYNTKTVTGKVTESSGKVEWNDGTTGPT